EIEAKKRFDENSSNEFAGRSLAIAKFRQGDTAGALELVRFMSVSTTARIDDHLFLAWHQALSGKPDGKSVDELKKAGERAADNPLYPATLANLQAITGSVDDAQQSFVRSIRAADVSDLPALTWAAYAEICGRYGFPEDAKAAVSHMREPK